MIRQYQDTSIKATRSGTTPSALLHLFTRITFLRRVFTLPWHYRHRSHHSPVLRLFTRASTSLTPPPPPPTPPPLFSYPTASLWAWPLWLCTSSPPLLSPPPILPLQVSVSIWVSSQPLTYQGQSRVCTSYIPDPDKGLPNDSQSARGLCLLKAPVTLMTFQTASPCLEIRGYCEQDMSVLWVKYLIFM